MHEEREQKKRAVSWEEEEGEKRGEGGQMARVIAKDQGTTDFKSSQPGDEEVSVYHGWLKEGQKAESWMEAPW